MNKQMFRIGEEVILISKYHPSFNGEAEVLQAEYDVSRHNGVMQPAQWLYRVDRDTEHFWLPQDLLNKKPDHETGEIDMIMEMLHEAS